MLAQLLRSKSITFVHFTHCCEKTHVSLVCWVSTCLHQPCTALFSRQDKGFQAALMAATTWIGMVPIFILFAIGDGGVSLPAASSIKAADWDRFLGSIYTIPAPQKRPDHHPKSLVVTNCSTDWSDHTIKSSLQGWETRWKPLTILLQPGYLWHSMANYSLFHAMAGETVQANDKVVFCSSTLWILAWESNVESHLLSSFRKLNAGVCITCYCFLTKRQMQRSHAKLRICHSDLDDSHVAFTWG